MFCRFNSGAPRCHCSTCRRFSGAPLVVWANAPGQALRITAGSPTGFASSDHWIALLLFHLRTGLRRYPTPPRDGSDLVCVAFRASTTRPRSGRPPTSGAGVDSRTSTPGTISLASTTANSMARASGVR